MLWPVELGRPPPPHYFLFIFSSLYASPVGPYVDGHIVPEKPEELMKKYSAKHDLMFGLTHSEVDMSDMLSLKLQNLQGPFKWDGNIQFYYPHYVTFQTKNHWARRIEA